MSNVHAHSIDYRAREDGERDRAAYLLNRGLFLDVDLPTNPLCWLLGHRPEAQIIHWGHRSLPSAWVRCAVCGHRHTDEERLIGFNKRLERLSPEEQTCEAEIFEERRVLRLVDPEERQRVLAAVDRRNGWGPVTRASGSLQVVIPRRLHREASLRLHLGNSGSETPYDGHLTVGGAGVYGGLGLPGRFAERLTGGQRSRDLQLRIDDSGTLRWDLLTSTEPDWRSTGTGGDRRRLPWWRRRRGHVSIRPLDHLQGGSPRNTWFTVGDPVTRRVRTAEGTEHDVVFTLEAWTAKRPKGPNLRTWLTVKWECREGIGCREPGRGRYMGSSVTLPDDVAWIDPDGAIRWAGGPHGWVPAAEEELTRWVTSRRHREGWKFDQPLASAAEGR